MELVLNTFGTSLNKDNDCFIISHKDGKQRIPVIGIKSIQIGKGAQITSDAVMLAIDNEIEVLFVDKSGSPIGRIWSPKYGSISSIRKGQLNFSLSKEALKWIKSVILNKIENQQAFLLTMPVEESFSLKNMRDKSIARLEDYRTKIDNIEGDVVPDVASQLRGWEGVASKIYFKTINSFLPPEYQFENRSQRPALDIVNALLNYGYGILYGKIEGALIKSGIDPYIGILHRDDYNRPVLVYDVIELYRVWVDYVVFNLVVQQVITDEYYSIRDDGSYWLEPLGRRVLIQSLNDYLEEIVQINKLQRSRLTHINLYAQNLAQKLKNFE